MFLFKRQPDRSHVTIERTPNGLDMISLDTTNHCNARCIFCFNDWDSFKPCSMKTDTFEKVLPILPLLNKDGQFLASCWFEPTINREFFKIVGMLPDFLKDRGYFTTNLVVPLSDDDLRAMCRANLDHINVSLETYDEKVYTHVTSVKMSFFYDNLVRLAKIAKEEGMDIWLISMLLKSNMEEFPSLVRKAHEEVGPAVHEIRSPFFYPADTENKPDVIEELLTREEFTKVREAVDALGYDNISWQPGPSKETFLAFEADKDGYQEKVDEVDRFWVRVNADGTARVGHPETGTLIDLKQTDDPAGAVLEELTRLRTARYRMNAVPAGKVKIVNERNADPFSCDKITICGGRFMEVNGWETGTLRHGASGAERVAVLEAGGKRYASVMNTVKRSDVADALKDPASEQAGFSVRFDPGFEIGDDFRLWTGYKTGDTIYRQARLY